jgi:hypothetical protein
MEVVARLLPGNSADSHLRFNFLEVPIKGTIPIGMGILTSNLLGLATSVLKLDLNSEIEPAIKLPYLVF